MTFLEDDWSALKCWRRRLMSPVYRLPDVLPGLRGLRTHILICGYPRAGTTMLLAMLEYALPQARRFGKETRGWRAATYCWRNHEVVISKIPKDLLVLDRLQQFYQDRRANLKTILVIRDPRDVLTSRHQSYQRQYFLDLHEWRKRHEYYLLHRNDRDTLVVKYEDIITKLNSTQSRIEKFTREKMTRPLGDFYTETRLDFDQRPLNGWRPVDARGIGRWKRPEHRERIRHILAELPDLPRILIDTGYESSDAWAKDPELR